ncbi:MAG TPA: DUF4035 domain-containing protein [Phycisphaerae bacterium]|nr:DUF4035 domain-containing protein [Phycisphaerae bacterium]
MTAAELLHRTSSADLAELAALEYIEPFGELRADLRAAMICQTIASCAGVKNATIADFMLRFDSDDESESSDQDVEQQKLIARLALGDKAT